MGKPLTGCSRVEEQKKTFTSMLPGSDFSPVYLVVEKLQEPAHMHYLAWEGRRMGEERRCDAVGRFK